MVYSDSESSGTGLCNIKTLCQSRCIIQVQPVFISLHASMSQGHSALKDLQKSSVVIKKVFLF